MPHLRIRPTPTEGEEQPESVTFISMFDRFLVILREYCEAENIDAKEREAANNIRRITDSSILDGIATNGKTLAKYIMLNIRAVCQLLDEHK